MLSELWAGDTVVHERFRFRSYCFLLFLPILSPCLSFLFTSAPSLSPSHLIFPSLWQIFVICAFACACDFRGHVVLTVYCNETLAPTTMAPTTTTTTTTTTNTTMAPASEEPAKPNELSVQGDKTTTTTATTTTSEMIG